MLMGNHGRARTINSGALGLAQAYYPHIAMVGKIRLGSFEA
jgi:hypothetical protein